MATQAQTSVGFGDYAKILRRRRMSVLLSAVIAVVSMLALDTLRTPLYTAQAKILFASLNSKNAVTGSQLSTDILVVQSPAVVHEVERSTGTRKPPKPVVASIGNTSAASIPLALDHYMSSGKIKTGDLIALAAVGGGLTWGSALLKI